MMALTDSAARTESSGGAGLFVYGRVLVEETDGL